MFNNFKYLILFFLFPTVGFSQLLDNSKCQVFSDEPFFNTKFIRKNGLRKITGVISTKKSLQVIEQRNLVNTYLFDNYGRLEKQYHSFNHSQKKDTTVINYYYNSKNNITTQRTSDSYGFFSNNFAYNSSNLIISKTYCRDENIGGNKTEFKLGKQHVIVKETFTHELSDSTKIQHTYNSQGKKYKTVTSFYNKQGFLIREEKKLTISKRKSITKYKYDYKGNISEKRFFLNYNKPNNKATKYKYDEFGNLEYIDEYLNDKHITHKEIIYNKSTLLMKALLIQDIETNFIKIIKYSYEYR